MLDAADVGAATVVHGHTASDITDFDTEVSNNADVAANTTARHAHSNKSVLDNTSASYTTDEKNKLNGIASGANNYSLPTASADVLGGVKIGSGVTITDGIISVAPLS